MRWTGVAIVLLILAVLAAAGWLLARRATISALDPPGRIETFVATHAKRWLVAKAARAPLPPEPAKTADTVSDGQMYYGSLCAGCHGYDARTPTPLGLALNPHAPSLAAPGVQRWSDAELFVIIRDGIRLSGMPAFGGSERSDQIWALMHYVRSLPTAPPRH